jgi:hypothetical protein
VDWIRHLGMMLHCPAFLWGPLYMCVCVCVCVCVRARARVQHCSEGKRGMSITGLLLVESDHLAYSHWQPFHQRHWTKLNCWTCDYWLFGGTVEAVTTLAQFQNLPQLT